MKAIPSGQWKWCQVHHTCLLVGCLLYLLYYSDYHLVRQSAIWLLRSCLTLVMVIDLDIWLAVWLLFGSLVRACNIRWSELGFWMVGLRWFYILPTFAPLNHLTLNSFFVFIYLPFQVFNNTLPKYEYCLFCIIDVANVIFIVKWISIINVTTITTNIILTITIRIKTTFRFISPSPYYYYYYIIVITIIIITTTIIIIILLLLLLLILILRALLLVAPADSVRADNLLSLAQWHL